MPCRAELKKPVQGANIESRKWGPAQPSPSRQNHSAGYVGGHLSPHSLFFLTGKEKITREKRGLVYQLSSSFQDHHEPKREKKWWRVFIFFIEFT